MKIMTFNTQHCLNFNTKKIDFKSFSREILFHNADITGLNEMRGFGPLPGYTAQTERLGKLTGMNYYFAKAINVAGLAPYGNGILSKFPIVSAETIGIPDPTNKTGTETYEMRCVLKAVIDAGRKYTVLVTHMGLNKDERENAVKVLLDNAPSENCIIMGDFNCLPDCEELTPLFERYNCSDVSVPTFPSDAPRIKIDYIFTSKDITVSDKAVSENIVSDHRSMWIEVKEN